MLMSIEIILWFIVVAIGYILAIAFLKQYIQRESLQRPFFLGLAVFSLTYSTARLIENFRRYFLGSYNDIFDAWVNNTQISGLNFSLRVWGYYLIAWIGIAIMYYNIERYIFKNNKYILTIGSMIEGAVSIYNYFNFNLITFWMSSSDDRFARIRLLQLLIESRDAL